MRCKRDKPHHKPPNQNNKYFRNPNQVPNHKAQQPALQQLWKTVQ